MKLSSSILELRRNVLIAILAFGIFFLLAHSIAFSDTPTPSAPASSTAPTQATPSAEDNSLEGLAQQKVEITSTGSVVTSSSKKSESLRRATSAIYVITSEDIARSGARYLPDLLAMVPGVEVSRQSGNEWAVSSRGFNDTFNDKMLVLVDGRSVYDPILGGVDWSEQDLMLEDIDHIEVIRGPGGTLWGSNAVNGVINIITKDAKVTQGLYLSGSAGQVLYSQGLPSPYAIDGLGAVRYGGLIGDNLYYRIYGQSQDRNTSQDPIAGGLAHDSWYDMRAGFRADWQADRDQITLQSEAQKGFFDYTRGDLPNNPTPDYINPNTFAYPWTDIDTTVDQNAHVLGRWTHTFDDGGDLQVLAYYDYINKTTANDSRLSNVGQADLEFQHRFILAGFNEITWGGSWRNIDSQLYNPINFVYDPDSQNINIYGAFLQDQLTLEGDRLYLTLGSKWENNPYTNDEFSPSVRVLWTPNPKDSIWAAVSKAERTPPEAAGSLNIYFGGIPPTFDPNGPYYFGLVPNPQLKSETLVAYELGYRTTPTQETSLDLSLYYNHYDNLISINDIGDYNPDGLPGFPPGPGLGIDGPTTPLGGTYMQVLQLQNTGSGAVYGAELSFKWDPQDNLHFAASYTYEDFDQQLKDSLNRELGAAPPHNLANGRVSWSPLKELELNTALYFTDTTTIYDPDPNQTSQTNSYFRWDLGARWKATENLEVSAWALDLEGAHTETLLSYGILPTQVTPTLYGQLALRY